jgi:serine/threonine-protein kinase
MEKPIFAGGEKVEDFLIESQISHSNMAEVYLAKDLVLQRDVVIKALQPVYHKDEEFKKRFFREARIQANLDSPYIIQIYRVFNHKDNFCLVMQHIEGTTLESIVKKAHELKSKKGEKGALSAERAINIFLQILEGIGFAHKYRIIHGDIKPSNILIDRQGRAKITDFGLSIFLPPDIKRRKSPISGGTPYYMAPEQIINQEIDFRSDVYSLGVTLFYMLSGELPCGKCREMHDILEYHVEGSLAKAKGILIEIKTIPPSVKEAVLQALEGKPENRHQSALEFSLALKVEAPQEMFSELLRFSLLTKSDITAIERAHLDQIAKKRGLTAPEIKAIEGNIRKEIGLPPMDFMEEYRNALQGMLTTGREERSHLTSLNDLYVKMGRLSEAEVENLEAEVKAGAKES